MEIKLIQFNTVVEGQLWYDYCTENPEMVVLHISTGAFTVSTRALDCFSALIEARKALEKSGIIPLVMGAHRRVYPSPMQLDMGDGRKAYLQEMGRRTRMSDCVDIFDPCNREDVASVAEQEQYHTSWISSIRKEC